jgi:hypothetical protein
MNYGIPGDMNFSTKPSSKVIMRDTVAIWSDDLI